MLSFGIMVLPPERSEEIIAKGRDVMGFWTYMLMMALLLPFTLLVFGIYFYKRAPKNINVVFGYRTSRSMKNMNTWRFAHHYCGRIWIVSGGVSLPLSILSMLLVIDKGENTIGYVGALWLFLPLILIVISIILTEKALKKKFDKLGQPKI